MRQSLEQNSRNRIEIPAVLDSILRRGDYPAGDVLKQKLSDGIMTLRSENPELRPINRKGTAGGLVRLKPGGYFIIIPDLHARMDFFRAVITWPGFSGRPVIDDMADGIAQVICVGDAFHSEARGRKRWKQAEDEWLSGYKHHRHMDREMKENLGLLEMIAAVKTAFPEQFHFLKGNHENIANEQGEGNYPFRKFAFEGEMVKLWVENFLGDEIFNLIYRWEKALPLMAQGPDFLITHCEPGRAVSLDEVINAYENPDVIYNLTWIDNNRAEEGSAAVTLANFGINSSYGRIFGGHRPVAGNYSFRQDGRYVQVNTPNKWVITTVTDMSIFNPERDIVCLKDDTQ